MSSGKRKSEGSVEEGVTKRLNMDPNDITICPSPRTESQINISPSIARNPNKYLGSGSHKKNLQEAIESNSQEPKTPTKSPTKRLSKFSPFKKSPGKSPRKEMFPKQIDDQESDSYINTYDRTFEKVLMVAAVQMMDWQEKNLTDDPLVDLEIMQKFSSLNQSSKNLYVRLVNRKHAWLKKSGLEEKYGKYGADILADLYNMTDAGVIESNYENEDLSTLLNLLQVAELKDFCKELKLSNGPHLKKTDLVDSIIKFAKSQRSLFGGDSSSKIKQLIKKYLGECVRLAPQPRDVFLSCVILVTFPFYYELSDHVTRLNDYISRIVRTVRGEIKFPSYELHRTCVFKNRSSFEQYIKAFELCTEIDFACKAKANVEAATLIKRAITKLREILKDKKAMSEIGDRPIYLRRYSAGYILVKTIFHKVYILKREFPSAAEQALLTLINQNSFKEQDKGVWYESLAQLYMVQFKDNNKAAVTLLKAFAALEELRLVKLSDEKRKLEMAKPSKKLKDLGWIKHSLIERATLLINRQKRKIDEDKAFALKKWITEIDDFLIPPDIVILSGKLMPNTNKGMKQIYMVEGKDGEGVSRSYMSVEDQAKEHFKRQGYIQSRHDEGATLKYMLYALLWEVIYSNPAFVKDYGVFQSPYQEVPLDWRTPNFFERRKEQIKKRLKEISQMTPNQLIAEVMLVVKNHVNESSVINNWACLSPDNVNILTNYTSCIGVPLFQKIGEYMIMDVEHNSKGFPDLTMWNPNQKKAIFVEVKSQNDRLSIHQKVWLHNLKSWGANCCVAHLKPTGGSKAIVEVDVKPL